MTTYTVTDAAGLPETVLPASLLSQLPASVAPAPWTAYCDVVTWLHPLGPEAVDAFPAAIRPSSVALVAWALVRYSDTPVGPYSEIAATLIPGDDGGRGHIPFIVVDSLASVVGGRVNWLLPKALARFDWSEDGMSVAIRSDQPATPAWSIDVSFSTTGEATQLAIPTQGEQATVDGVARQFDGEMSGSMRSARVDVSGQADGPLAALLVPGEYDGTELRNAVFEVGALND